MMRRCLTIALAIAASTLIGCASNAATHRPANHNVPFCRTLQSGSPVAQCLLSDEVVWSTPADAASQNPNTEIWVLLPASCTLGAPYGSNAAYFPCTMDERAMANGYGVADHLSEGATIYIRAVTHSGG